ncbi:MAG TPA: MFS transporter [Methylomirabilota bacterium]|nr:MFS transporter [Methylomirabilota bacterium]
MARWNRPGSASTPGETAIDRGGREDTLWLAGLCAARAGVNTMTMAYPAVLSVVQQEWGLSAKAAGSISSAFQIGTAVALVVVSALADYMNPRAVWVAAAAATAAVSLVIPVLAQGYLSAMALFTAVAVALAGTYTPGIMLIAERFGPERRGRAVGWFLAASSLGYVVALALGGLVVARLGWRPALLVLAGGPVVSLVLALALFRGERQRVRPPAPRFSLDAGLRRNRPAQLMIAGYVFHSWELLGMWAWAPAFVAAALAAHGKSPAEAAGIGAGLAAVFHVMGMIASATGGSLSDRWGRTAVIAGMMAVSSACSFSFGWLLTAPVLFILLVGSVYGFTALGDSPVYSTGITETVPAARLGSALAVRSLLGFGAGAVSPWVFGWVLDLYGGRAAGTAGWGWAFAVLGVGGVLGLGSMLWLRALPESRRLAGGKR